MGNSVVHTVCSSYQTHGKHYGGQSAEQQLQLIGIILLVLTCNGYTTTVHTTPIFLVSQQSTFLIEKRNQQCCYICIFLAKVDLPALLSTQPVKTVITFSKNSVRFNLSFYCKGSLQTETLCFGSVSLSLF